MKILIMLMAISFLPLYNTTFGENFSRDYNFEKKLDNLLSNKSEKPDEIGEFFKLSLLNDENIIETKVDITNYKRQVQTSIAEVLVKNDFMKPSPEEQTEINEMWGIIRKCSELEDRIWILIKSRRLWEEKERRTKLAEKPSHHLD